MSKETTRSVVVAAGSVTTKDGREHKQGAKVTLPDVEARELLFLGVVREPAAEASLADLDKAGLQAEAEKRGLPTSGTKAELLAAVEASDSGSSSGAAPTTGEGD